MATRSIVTHQPDVACDVCGRRLLRGEQPDVFVASGRRRTVCELCIPRATEEGWTREAELHAAAAREKRIRAGRSLFERFKQRRDASLEEQSREEPPTRRRRRRLLHPRDDEDADALLDRALGGGEAASERTSRDSAAAARADLEPTAAEASGAEDPDGDPPDGAYVDSEHAGREPVGAESAGAGRASGEHAGRERAGAEHAGRERAGAAHPEGEHADGDPAAGGRRPQVSPVAAPAARARRDAVPAAGPRQREESSAAAPRHREHARLPIEQVLPHPPFEQALEAFNASHLAARVAGIARSLGSPHVAVRAVKGTEATVAIIVEWELCWYRYEIDLAQEDPTVRLVADGTELDELPEEDRVGNASADERGFLSLLV